MEIPHLSDANEDEMSRREMFGAIEDLVVGEQVPDPRVPTAHEIEEANPFREKCLEK